MTEIVAPFQQFFDTSGAPLANGAIYIGTANLDAETNPIAVFWDEALTIPAPQPIRTLNGYPARNSAPSRLYASVESYSITVRNAQGRIMYSVLDATSATLLSDANGSSLVGFIQNGSSAVPRTSQSKMREIISVKDFGAVGDGVANDTAIFSILEAKNDVNFFYLPDGTYNVSGISLKKTYYGPGTIRLNNVNRPQILANDRPQAVVVFPPVANASNVLLPDKTWLNVSGSTTSGLQEAINYACGTGTAGSGSFDLHIVGSEEKGPTYTPGGAVVYSCTSPIVFPAMQGKRITSGAVTFNFSGIGDQPCVTFNSCMMVDVNLAGAQIVNGGTGNCLVFKPTTGVPLDGGLFGVSAIIDSKFCITTVVNINNSTQATSLGACVLFDPSQTGGTGILNSHFEFGEINQQNTAPNTSGIWIFNSTPSRPFANNFIKCLHLHNHRGVGVQIGTSPAISGYGNNTFYVVANASSGAAEDFNTFGSDDTFIISSESFNQQYGLRLQSSASGNQIISNRLNGSIGPVFNNATNKTSNQWLRAKGLAQSSVPVTGSPFTYQNTDLTQRIALVQGGTHTAETQFSVDGISFYNTGLTGGQFTLPPGAFLRVHYSVAPTFNVFGQS